MTRIILSILFALAPVVAYAQTKSLTFCAYDYMANCSDYPLTSMAARQCMADVGVDLSPRCVEALVEDGLVTKEQVIAFAKRKGVTVIDTPEGLKKVDPKDIAKAEEVKPEVKVEEPKETATPVEVIIPKKQETEEIVLPKENVVKKTFAKAKTATKKATSSVKKTYTKVKTAVKKYTKKNKDYSARANIKEQNRLRQKERRNNFIVPDGVNADFGRYEPRPKGYTRKRFKYSWKKHMEDHSNGMIRAAGINAQF